MPAKYSAEAYQKANTILVLLRKWRHALTPQEVKTLQGQALSGDVEGAHEGLGKILRSRGYVL